MIVTMQNGIQNGKRQLLMRATPEGRNEEKKQVPKGTPPGVVMGASVPGDSPQHNKATSRLRGKDVTKQVVGTIPPRQAAAQRLEQHLAVTTSAPARAVTHVGAVVSSPCPSCGERWHSRPAPSAAWAQTAVPPGLQACASTLAKAHGF